LARGSALPPEPVPPFSPVNIPPEVLLTGEYVVLAVVHDDADTANGRGRPRLLTGFDLPLCFSLFLEHGPASRPALSVHGFDCEAINRALEDVKADLAAAAAERARQAGDEKAAEGGKAEVLAAEPNAGKPLLNERRTVLMKKAEAARILTGRQSARSRDVKNALARYDWRDEGDRKGTLRLDKMDTETAARFRGQDKVSHRELLGGPRKDARPAKT
jgi:hypothetical protein